MPQARHGMAFRKLTQGGCKRFEQKLRALPLLSLRKQTGQLDFNDAVLTLDLHALHNCGRCEVFLFFYRGGRINEMPEPTGNPLGPQRRVGGQYLVVFGIALDVGGVERI